MYKNSSETHIKEDSSNLWLEGLYELFDNIVKTLDIFSANIDFYREEFVSKYRVYCPPNEIISYPFPVNRNGYFFNIRYEVGGWRVFEKSSIARSSDYEEDHFINRANVRIEELGFSIKPF